MYWTSCVTDIGIKKQTNQDSLLLQRAATNEGEVLLAVVADGVGGWKKGELASSTAVHHLKEWFKRKLPQMLQEKDSIQTILESAKECVLKVDRKLKKYANEHGESIGTTIALLFLYQYHFFIIHVGDSRVYGCDSTETVQLTRDHTWVQQQVELGKMTTEEAVGSKQKNILMQCLGGKMPVLPECREGILAETTTFLLCSDGFYNTYAENEMQSYLQKMNQCEQEEFQRIPAKMIQEIKERGESDNISVIVVRAKR